MKTWSLLKLAIAAFFLFQVVLMVSYARQFGHLFKGEGGRAAADAESAGRWRAHLPWAKGAAAAANASAHVRANASGGGSSSSSSRGGASAAPPPASASKLSKLGLAIEESLIISSQLAREAAAELAEANAKGSASTRGSSRGGSGDSSSNGSHGGNNGGSGDGEGVVAVGRKLGAGLLARRVAAPKKKKVVTERALKLRAMQAAHGPGTIPKVESTAVFPPGNEAEQCVGTGASKEGVVAAVVTVTFDREEYLGRMLESLLKVHGSYPGYRLAFPLFISQDFDDPAVQDVAYSHLDRGIRYLQHVERAPPTPERKREKLVYYRIANHYRFIFRTFFDCFGYDRLIILEDDMQLAPDFFSYFEALAPVLDKDPTLYCVSSWNDHGQDRFVRDTRRLYRSDFFPGLGWMTNRATWDSIKASWPRGYWDDWMRLNATRRGRQCIRPEVCRTYNFGEHGSSDGQFFKQYLKPVLLNSDLVPWEGMDLSYLEPERYAREFEAALRGAVVANTPEEAWAQTADTVLYYDSQRRYDRIAYRLRMMKEWKDGVPRGSYKGVVTLRNSQGALLYVAPAPNATLAEKFPVPAFKGGLWGKGSGGLGGVSSGRVGDGGVGGTVGASIQDSNSSGGGGVAGSSGSGEKRGWGGSNGSGGGGGLGGSSSGGGSSGGQKGSVGADAGGLGGGGQGGSVVGGTVGGVARDGGGQAGVQDLQRLFAARIQRARQKGASEGGGTNTARR